MIAGIGTSNFSAGNSTKVITFVELPAEKFDVPIPAIIKFTFQNSHYQDVMLGQSFTIMEGFNQVGEGKIISIEIEKCEVRI